jgi:hypothetical protein
MVAGKDRRKYTADPPLIPQPQREIRSDGTMTRRFAVIALLLVIVLFTIIGAVITFGEFVAPVLFKPDGRNLVKNGSFEDGNLTPSNDEQVVAQTGLGDCKLLCDGSTTIDGWLASGKGPLPPQTCSNGKASDAVCWVIKQENGIAAKDGIRFVDLTGFNSRLHDRYGSVSQGVPTEVGKRYELSFAIGSSSNFPRGATGLGVTVEIPAIVIPGVTDGIFFAIEISVPPQTVSQWSDHRFRFTARNETTTLIFTGASLVRGAEGDYIGLDNVSLQKVCFIVFAQSDSGCP